MCGENTSSTESMNRFKATATQDIEHFRLRPSPGVLIEGHKALPEEWLQSFLAKASYVPYVPLMQGRGLEICVVNDP